MGQPRGVQARLFPRDEEITRRFLGGTEKMFALAIDYDLEEFNVRRAITRTLLRFNRTLYAQMPGYKDVPESQLPMRVRWLRENKAAFLAEMDSYLPSTPSMDRPR